MKIFLLIAIFCTSGLFAQYNYQNQNYGKIDMHGGKKDSLTSGKSNFSNKLGFTSTLKKKAEEKKELEKDSKDKVLEDKKNLEKKKLQIIMMDEVIQEDKKK